VLFVPGYAFIAALFPKTEDKAVLEDDDADTDSDRITSAVVGRSRIDGLERVALSIGTSIAIVPLIGLGLNFTPWGIRLVPVALAVGGFTLVASWVALTRRLALPEADRFAVPWQSWLGTARKGLL
jgi:uncharacterized membrane protein